MNTQQLEQAIPKKTALKKNTSQLEFSVDSETYEERKSRLWKIFKRNFKQISGNDFIENKETLQNISILFFYFLGNSSLFLSHPNLVKLDKHKSNLDKGLLIIGGYGVGKTETMKALELTFQFEKGCRFKVFNANSVVNEYEEAKTAEDKKCFNNKFKNGVRCFDDVKTEREASNYGKINVFKEILEIRYANKKKTFIICNYKVGFEGGVEMALQEFGEIYGGRVHDRLYDMFNIVEFKGLSMRGVI